MDPATVIGLACNVLQLIDSGIKIGKEIHEVYKSGSHSALDEVRDWAESVENINIELQRKIPVRDKKAYAFDDEVLQLAVQTTARADELKGIVEKIVPTAGSANFMTNSLKRFSISVKQITRVTLSSRKTKDLKTQLQRCKDDLDSAILKALYVRSINTQHMVANVYPKLSENQKVVIRQITDRDNEMRQRIEQIESSLKSTVESTVGRSTKFLDERLHDTDARHRREQARGRLLRSLEYDTIQHRRNVIQGRVGDYQDTFGWIFEPGQPHGFYEWLSAGAEPYWISGLPGSGKSSLVNYILQQLENERSARNLIEKWSDPEPVTVLSFFFYTTDRLQRTFEGLYRSLCYQMLVNDHALCEKALNDLTAPATFRRLVTMDHEYGRHWLTVDLKQLFTYLVTHVQCKIFMLLDGLDEFGDRDRGETHRALVNAIKEMSNLPGKPVKICCSSRPDAPFDTTLAPLPGLKVQDLTRNDIESFVEKQLIGTRASKLASEVVMRAEGVFLWAHLVSEAICRGISEGEPLNELEKLTKSTPGDMKELFAAMLKRANPSHAQSPKPFLQYIIIGKDLREDTSLSELLFVESDQDELSRCLKEGFSTSFVSSLLESAKTFQQHVVARCAGLVHVVNANRREKLESGDDSCRTSYCGPTISDSDLSTLWQISLCKFDFIHRTAYDYVKDDPDGQMLNICSMSEDAAVLALLRANVARTVLGLDHPLLGKSLSARVFSQIRKIIALQRSLEAFPNRHPSYHLLTDQFLDKLVADLGHTSATPTVDAFKMMINFWFPTWSIALPLGISMRLAYGIEYDLFSYVTNFVRGLPSGQRQTATILAWWKIASLLDADAIVRQLKFVADLQRLCAFEPVTCNTICQGLCVFNVGGHAYKVEARPLWMMVISSLVNTWLKGWRYYEGKAAILAVLRSLKSDGSPSEESFELSICRPDSYDDGSVTLGPAQWLGDGPEMSQLLLRCTVRTIICLLLPESGFAEWGLSGIGELPEPLRWKPSGLDRWLDLQQCQDWKLWMFKDGRFQLNDKCKIKLSRHLSGKLDADEMAVLAEGNRSLSSDEFFVFRQPRGQSSTEL